jgi:Domain of unknown function (DUF4832)/Domain of unknown function (DUF4874)
MNHSRSFSRFSFTVVFFSLLTALAACGGESDSVDDADDVIDNADTASDSDTPIAYETSSLTSGNAPLVTFTYSQSAEDFVNPERGYYTGYNLVGASTTSAANIRTGGHSLAIAIVRLDDYRSKALDSTILTNLDKGFAAARAAGIKVVLRFAYNASFSADASKSRILGHISQLAPVLQKNADVIAVMQAGFIGAWGEWHSSTNGLDNNTDRKDILSALLTALPATRAVEVRTPMFKGNIFGTTPLSSTEAFTGTARARLGHHNDCFLASSTDYGTYASPVDTWKAYTSADTSFVPMGGETCAVSAYTTCTAAKDAMAKNHWSYLNQMYLGSVVDGWTSGGCGTEIRQRLGYRFAVKRVAHNSSVRPGGLLDVEVDVKNYGFAAPFNKRHVYLVLTGGGKRQVASLSSSIADVRRFAPGATTTIRTRLRIPATTASGTYTLSLWMPDDATTLKNDARFAIRTANAGAWNATTGDNLLSKNVVVSTSAPGPYDSTATSFAAVP